jgi:hypothetical protein
MWKIFLHGHMLSTAGDALRTNWQGDSCNADCLHLHTPIDTSVIQFPMCGLIRNERRHECHHPFYS